MKVGSLFSGIGGLDLGLEWAGFEIAWMCEINPFARGVLAHHWPNIPIYEDITTLYDPAPVDVLAGGFPCQNISNAGKREGINGSKSGLWKEYARLIRLLRPSYIIVENVSALTNRGLNRVLGDLAALRYDAEWECIPASAFGAPHRRDRLYLLAYPMREGRERLLRGDFGGSEKAHPVWKTETVGDVRGIIPRLEEGLGEPSVFGDAHGLPPRLDLIEELQSHGNAVVPQVAYWLGECVKADPLLTHP